MIRYPYLGFGDIFFYLQNPSTGAWSLAHTIRYANTTASVQITNPNMYFLGYAYNGAGGTLEMYCGSYAAFVGGQRSFIGNPKGGTGNNKSAITTETCLINLKNAAIYNGVANHSPIRVLSMTVSSSAANGIATFRLRSGATIGGTPSYTPFNGSTSANGAAITSGHSVASVDTAGTTISGGVVEFVVTVDNPNTTFIDLTPYNVFVASGNVLSASGESSNSSQLGVTLNWSEDI
jgi:hypothetical protein